MTTITRGLPLGQSGMPGCQGMLDRSSRRHGLSSTGPMSVPFPLCNSCRAMSPRTDRRATCRRLLRSAIAFRSMNPRWLLGPGSSPTASQRKDMSPITRLTARSSGSSRSRTSGGALPRRSSPGIAVGGVSLDKCCPDDQPGRLIRDVCRHRNARFPCVDIAVSRALLQIRL